MTDRTEINATPTSDSEAIRIRAAEWLVSKRTAREWTEDDQKPLDEWLRESDENLLAYWRLEAGWERTRRLAALRTSPPKRPNGRLLFRVSAALVLVAAFSGGAWIYFAKPTGTVYETSVGGRETVMLEDGSRVELNTDTRIRLSAHSSERNVWLEKGEAYFQVVHDSRHPLNVYAGARRITDLGTQFVVRRARDDLEVSVLEGRVNFDAIDDSDRQRSLNLSQGDAVLATPAGLSVKRKSEVELSNELGWRRGVLVFTNASLAQAVEQLSRYTAVKIVIADERVGRLPVNGTVSATDPQEFLQMTRSVFGLRAEKLNGEYVISR